MAFCDQSLAAKYSKLGFVATDLGMDLRIGQVRLGAVEHPLKGVVVFFTSVTPRTATHYESGVASACSVEQIAGVIYANFAMNFREDAEACKQHFEARGVRIFQ